jgi:hypothetical protein
MTKRTDKGTPERVKEFITDYGPTLAAFAQAGLQWWFMLRHGSAG